jgi:molybdopterin synthase catalytic subunit
MSFQISSNAIEPEALKRRLTTAGAGACVSFEGWVRNHADGVPVMSLEYETHAALATKEGETVLAEAKQRFAIERADCVHRVGHLRIGDCAVWVGVSAAHRGAAFDACRYIIDEIKQRLPIWKKEHYASGESGWVNCSTGAARQPGVGAALAATANRKSRD